MVCPYGAIKMDKQGKVVAKCDFCSELEEPACVANCPNQALIVKEVKPIMAKYVIVGASAAGIGAVEAIREVDPDRHNHSNLRRTMRTLQSTND